MKIVDKIVQDIEYVFEPLRSMELDEQDFEIEIPFSKDNDRFWTSLNNELDSRGITYKLLDTYETDKTTIYYVMLRRKWKPEYYDEGVNRKIKLRIKEATSGRHWVAKESD